MTGAASKNLIIKVPLGTQILSEDKSTVLADMIDNNQKFINSLKKFGNDIIFNNENNTFIIQYSETGLSKLEKTTK